MPETVGEIAACVYRSLAVSIAAKYEAVLQVLDEKLELLQIVGGGTQNHLLCQWISNVMGIPCICGPTETTAMGNLLFQLKAHGIVHTLEEGRAICAASSELYEVKPEDMTSWKQELEHYKAVMGVLK